MSNFANIAASSHELTKKAQKYIWGEAHQAGFKKLKGLLCSAPILAYPIAGEKFVLDTDASGFGIGGAISQVANGVERVVGYYSGILSKPERNYCKYLYGQHLELRRDHSAIRWLLQFNNPGGQIANPEICANDYPV